MREGAAFCACVEGGGGEREEKGREERKDREKRREREGGEKMRRKLKQMMGEGNQRKKNLRKIFRIHRDREEEN